MGSQLKNRLVEGRIAFSTSVQFACPEIVELIGRAGYDFAWIDCGEHGTYGFETSVQMIRAAEAYGDQKMNAATHKVEGNARVPVLYMALELCNTTWKVVFGDGLRRRQVAVPAGELGRLQEAVAEAKERFGLASSSQVLSCYEAGRGIGPVVQRELKRAVHQPAPQFSNADRRESRLPADASTDASWINILAGVPVIMFSPGEGIRAGNVDESVRIRDLVDATRVVAQFIREVLS